MNTFYLLPCPCSRKIPVQPRQAGETIICACGATLEVPSLLGLRALERAEVPAEPKTPKTAWSTGHRLIFLGAVIIVAAIAIGIWLFWFRPTDPYANFTPDQMKQAAQTLTPIQSWRLWQMLEKGGLERRKRVSEIVFADQQAQHQIYWWLLGLVAGTGLAFVAAGIIVVNLRRKAEGGKKDEGGRRKAEG